jgi:hypothetical protein
MFRKSLKREDGRKLRRENNRKTEVCEDENNRMGKVSNRRWEKIE